jgi:hypothetical protein
MTRATVAVLALGAALATLVLGAAACREEPTIVIKFEPNDLGARPPEMAKRPADLAQPAPDLATAQKEPPPGKKKAAECKVAADCVVEPLDCCDCANGGKQHAIAKKLAAASKARRDQRCKHTMCTMMLSTDPSCGQRADCVDGACVMVKR